MKNFKDIITSYDEKIKNVNDRNFQIKEIQDIMLDKMESEFVGLHDELHTNEKTINRKIDRDEITKIWDHFQRFAEYKDLKHLHAICIPEIAKFE